MKIPILLLTLLLTLSNVGWGWRTQNGTRPNIGAPQEDGTAFLNSPLQLVTEVIKETYCESPDPDLLSLRLLLRLTFTNASGKTMILEKESNLVPVIKISNTLEDATTGRAEKTINNYIITSNESPSLTPGDLTSDRFIIIPPGGSYKTITDVFVPVPRLTVLPVSVAPGEHYLRIAVWTWSESQAKAKQLRRRWSHIGRLWSATLISKPMPFTVEPMPKPEDCSCQDFGISEEQAVNIANKDMSATNPSPRLYKPVVFQQGCEWHLVYEPRNKRTKVPTLIYIIEKTTGNILERLEQ